MVVRNSARDCLTADREAQSPNNRHRVTISENIQAREELLEKITTEEILQEVRRRVRGQVSDRDWDIYCAIRDEGIGGRELAEKWGESIEVVYQASSRVQKKFREALNEVSGECQGPVEE